MYENLIDSRPTTPGVKIDISKATADDIHKYAVETANENHKELTEGEFATVDRLIQLLECVSEAIQDNIDAEDTAGSDADEVKRGVIVEKDFVDVLPKSMDVLSPYTSESRIEDADVDTHKEYVVTLIDGVKIHDNTYFFEPLSETQQELIK